MIKTLALCLAAALLQSASPVPSPSADAPFVCDNCETWNQPQEPFKIHGRTYYVGVHGLSAVLIQTSAGMILLDGGLPQSAPLIEANVRKLEFPVEEIKLILNSHAHYDHAGGIARLQRTSGATVAASAPSAAALRAGTHPAGDPQASGPGNEIAFPRVAKVRVVKNGETLRLGDTKITAHFTPGHTPGSTTWTWQSCVENECKTIVYADSLNAVSNDGFRFSGDRTHPDITASFQKSIDVVAALPCDILVSVHPEFSQLFEKLQARSAPQEARSTTDPFIDPQACATYAKGARERLNARLKAERDSKSHR